MTADLFLLHRLQPGLHLQVSDQHIRLAMDDAELAKALAADMPRAWRYIEPETESIPVFLYWERICVEAHCRPRDWVQQLLSMLEQTRPVHTPGGSD
jgi:hypothetical protein